MIVRFEGVKVTKPYFNYSSRRRNGEAGHGRVTLEITFQAMAHAADLQRLAESNETFAVSFTRMSEVVANAEADWVTGVTPISKVIADAEKAKEST